MRLTRDESRTRTCGRLIASAKELFARDGYSATSVEKIAENAGFSKGAVYSNFESKEAIFLAALDQHGQQSLSELLDAIDVATDRDAVIDLLANWADTQSSSGSWSLTILEHARLAGPDAPSLTRQREILQGHWLQLGERVAARLPTLTVSAQTIGALLHELAYAPALTFMDSPRSGDLVRLALLHWANAPG